eukprot:gene30327-35319_t
MGSAFRAVRDALAPSSPTRVEMPVDQPSKSTYEESCRLPDPSLQFGVRNSFGRQLSQLVDPNALLGNVPLYLIPTSEPQLCQGDTCCQADDYASPYRVQALNYSVVHVGGQVLTTFYMQLISQDYCAVQIDAAGCCNADIQAVWIDVDPEHKVLFATLNGSPASLEMTFVSKTPPVTPLLARVPDAGETHHVMWLDGDDSGGGSDTCRWDSPRVA